MRTKEQTAAQNRRYHESHREERKAYQRRMRWERKTGDDWLLWARKKLLSDAARRAAKTGIDFDITVDDIGTPATCPALGLPLLWRSTARQDQSPTIDRLDNSKGYVRGNVWVISWRANRIKSDATPAELRAIADAAGRLLDGLPEVP